MCSLPGIQKTAAKARVVSPTTSSCSADSWILSGEIRAHPGKESLKQRIAEARHGISSQKYCTENREIVKRP